MIPEDAKRSDGCTSAVGSGLVYAGDILIDDTKTRTIETKGNVTRIRLTSKAQDHETSKVYTVVIRKMQNPKYLQTLILMQKQEQTDLTAEMQKLSEVIHYRIIRMGRRCIWMVLRTSWR